MPRACSLWPPPKASGTHTSSGFIMIPLSKMYYECILSDDEIHLATAGQETNRDCQWWCAGCTKNPGQQRPWSQVRKPNSRKACVQIRGFEPGPAVRERRSWTNWELTMPAAGKGDHMKPSGIGQNRPSTEARQEIGDICSANKLWRRLLEPLSRVLV